MYNPFGKPIDEIVESDLNVLKQKHVAEGLYIEYKSDFPPNVKISHSIASFANSYGGWYFVGIKADQNNEPEDFCGFNLSIHKSPKEKVRDIVVGHIDPIPKFYSKLITLSNGRGLLVVQIPESDEPPHITRDGRIYRRNAEGSDPVAENDRYTIDKLYEKSKRFEKMIDNFCRMEIEISKAQENQGWLEAYFIPHPLDMLYIKNFFTSEQMKELRNHFQKESKLYGSISAGIPFENVFFSLNSVILRQTREKKYLPYLTATVQLFANGSAKMVIPFPYLGPSKILEDSGENEVLSKLLKELTEENLDLYKVIQGGNLCLAFITLSAKYVELLHNWKFEEELLVKYRIDGAWRNVIFFDSERYLEQIEQYGPPICQQDRFEIPPPERGTSIKKKVPTENIGLASDFGYISESLGIPLSSFPKILTDVLRKNLKKPAVTSSLG